MVDVMDGWWYFTPEHLKSVSYEFSSPVVILICSPVGSNYLPCK